MSNGAAEGRVNLCGSVRLHSSRVRGMFNGANRPDVKDALQ